MKKEKTFFYLIIILFLQLFFANNSFAAVYLFTDHSPIGHSILVHVASDGTVQAINPYPGKDPAVRITNGILFNGVVRVYDFNTGQSFGDYGMLDLGVEENSLLESRILQQINFYQAHEISGNWSDYWIVKNCGQSTFEALHAASYFDSEVLEARNKEYGEFELINSPDATEYAVRLQILTNAAKQRKTEEESLLVNDKSDDPGNASDGDTSDVSSGNNGDADDDNVISQGSNASGDNVCDPGDSDSEAHSLWYGGNNSDGDDVCYPVGDVSGDSTTPVTSEPSPPEPESRVSGFLGNFTEDNSPSVGEFLDNIMESSSIVLPSIPHFRVLWFLAGESWVDIISDAAGGIWNGLKNLDTDKITESISDEMGFEEMKEAIKSLGD